VNTTRDPDIPGSEPTQHGSEILARPLEATVVRSRGSAAIFYVVSWGFGNLVATFLGSVVLARMLSPREFGLIAFGNTIALLAGVLSEGGIASGYIRQSHGVSKSVLRSVNGVQLCLSILVAGIIALISSGFGLAGALTALMVWSLPVASPQTGGRILLIRELRFRDMSIAEAVGVAVYYLWSIPLVATGMGVWALATGVIVRAFAITLAVAAFTGWGLMVPSLRAYRDVLRVAGFGIRFSTTWLANVLYVQGQNIVIGVSGGVASLGLWSLATRVMQLPNLMYVPLHQVAFPAFSHLIAAGEDPRPLLERVSRVSFTASAIVLSSFTVAMPGLIPAVFGAQWRDAVLVLPGVSLAIFLAAPIVAPCSQFLFAANRPSVVLNATVSASIAGLCATTALTWAVGLVGAGLGAVVTAVIESVLLARATRAVTGADLWSSMPRLLLVSVGAATTGYAAGAALGYTVFAAIVASVVALAVSVAGCAILQPAPLRDLVHVVRRSMGSVFRSRGADPETTETRAAAPG
jgi:O-antigen/teichoic acid export membrane protein